MVLRFRDLRKSIMQKSSVLSHLNVSFVNLFPSLML